MHVYCVVRHSMVVRLSRHPASTFPAAVWFLHIVLPPSTDSLTATLLNSLVSIRRPTSQGYDRRMMPSSGSILSALGTGRSMLMRSSAMHPLRVRCKSTSGALLQSRTAQTCGASTLSSSRTVASALEQSSGDSPCILAI